MGLFDIFTGKAQRDDISRGRAEADAALDKGYGQFKSTREDYLGRSLGEFDGLQGDIQAGRDANNLYRIALGLDGSEAQQGYFDAFNEDPGYQALQANAVNAVENSAAARGGLFSGSTVRGITDRVSLMKNNLFNDRLNRLAQLGQSGASLGYNTAAARSGLLNSTGTDIGDAQFGMGQLKANNAVSANNAIGQTRAAPINNLIGLMSAGARIAGAVR